MSCSVLLAEEKLAEEELPAEKLAEDELAEEKVPAEELPAEDLAAEGPAAGLPLTACCKGCKRLDTGGLAGGGGGRQRGTRGSCGQIENAAHPALRPELRYNRVNELQIQAMTGIGRMR
ncbi:hypothetical protein ABEX25_24990 [Paenibacillus thiaminolyticus]|uniref:hypothetical protein n=1 Tax=Paenibacillus thiaminolyticus TaxID=49283 RepID=UPI003D2E337F